MVVRYTVHLLSAVRNVRAKWSTNMQDLSRNHKSQLALALLTLALALAGCGGPEEATQPIPAASATPIPADTATDLPIPAIAWEQPAHRIGVRALDGRGELYDTSTGEPFIARGVNYLFVPTSSGRNEVRLLKVGIYDAERTREDFSQLASLGYNTVRVFLDHCNAGPGCITEEDDGGLNPAYLDNVADMMAAAKDAGIVILFTSNDLPDQGGYSSEANSRAGPIFAGYRNSYYLTPEAIRATRRYWRDLLTGLKEREAAFDAVLSWQLLNEQWMFRDQPPLSLSEGTVETTTGTYDMALPEEKARMVDEGLINYISEMKEEILTHDPTALVTMGFFVPDLVAPDWYVQTAPLLAGSPLDFFDFHAYPGSLSLADHAEHFGMVGYDQKPIILGEYGAFWSEYADLDSAARAISKWASEACDYGFDGWLYWAYYSPDPGVGDGTWSFTDDDGLLMELFAPVNQPDPCVGVELEAGNAAYGKPVQASSHLPEEPPELAVDGDTATQWGAGADAPQWIEIDLEGAFDVSEIRLWVAQFPEGPTRHRILVRTAGATQLTLVHEFVGSTQAQDLLVFKPEASIPNVESVRVESISSPSWIAWAEIQILTE